jgi:hypothetical protein
MRTCTASDRARSCACFLVVRQRAHAFSGREVKKTHRRVVRSCDDLWVRGLRDDAGDRVCVSDKRVNVRLRSHVPNSPPPPFWFFLKLVARFRVVNDGGCFGSFVHLLADGVRRYVELDDGNLRCLSFHRRSSLIR